MLDGVREVFVMFGDADLKLLEAIQPYLKTQIFEAMPLAVRCGPRAKGT